MSKAGKWDSVFEAHPKVKEIFIGQNKAGIEQPFLKMGDAVNFAGTSERVTSVKKETPSKSTDKSPAEPPASDEGEEDTTPKGKKSK